MNPENERLIALATRPLDDNAELQLAAAAELRRRLDDNPSPGLVTAAADALEHADKHPRRRHWRTALYLTTLLVSLSMIVHVIRELPAFQYAYEISPFYNGEEFETRDSFRDHLTHQQRIFLFGEVSAPTKSTKWKPLWDSAPENPAYLAEYAKAYCSEHNNLSPEILKAAEQIDSDNGWFLALAAGGIAHGAVTKLEQTSREKKEFKTPVWKINDPKKIQETLQLIHQAAQKHRFRSYEEELMRQRISLLPIRTDCSSQIRLIIHVASQASAIVHLRKLVDTMCAGAQDCAAKGDVAGFLGIVRDWEAIDSKLIANGFSLLDLLVARVFHLAPAENFRDAAVSLGLEREAERFSQLLETKKAERRARDQRNKAPVSEHIAIIRGSTEVAFSLPLVARQVQNPPPLGEADLRPGRYAEHALLMRMLALATWVLLGLAAGAAALHRFVQNPLVRKQSARMQDLLKFSDWIWILPVGVLMPVLWYQGIIHLTPLSSREWSLKLDGGQQFACQAASMILLMLVLTTVLCGWRLARRGKVIGLSARFQWLGGVAACCAALAIPVSGAVLPAAFAGDSMKWPATVLLWLGYALLAIPALWLLVGFSRTVLGRHVHALRRATMARMLLPAWIFGMLVMVVSMPFHYAEERRWIQQDKLFEITAEAPAMSRYEWDVTQQLRKELLEMMR